MLYGCFRFFMIGMSITAIIHMLYNDSYTYIIFPISTLIWGFYSFFKNEDDEWCRRNGIKRDSWSWLLGIDINDGYDRNDYYGNRYSSGYDNYYGVPDSHIRTYNQTTVNKYHYSDPEYKKILPRCRKNSIVSIEKIKTK